MTNGPLALREVIHPKANLEGTSIPEVLYSYVDVDSVFRNTYPEAKNDVCKNVTEIATRILFYLFVEIILHNFCRKEFHLLLGRL